MALLIALLIAAIAGLIAKFIVSLFAPKYQDVAGLIVFLIVLLSRLGY